ncbi:hypothetical protein LT337_31830 (plasmid) [Mycolicibacterium fortuitum]|uniref:hypothetical protein n=1 Tax=Mycolicibacterium conceptionense TaxID=451644 RepID=UPI003204B31C|nr:hypothetical protein LT337_31830 [Mycolicibacterium fortuitum]
MIEQREWFDAVIRLCRSGFDPDGASTGGAQVQVFNRDTGELVYRQPIAREVRLEEDEPLLWFRQVIGTGPEFDLEECRRRALSTTDVVIEDDGRIVFAQPEVSTGEYAVIQRAEPDQIAVLDAWDAWKLTAISAEVEAAVDRLDDD